MDLKVEEVKKVAVVGAGRMGHGIAQVCARTVYQGVLLDINDEILEKALFLIKDGPFGLMRLVGKKKLEKGQVDEIMARIKPKMRALIKPRSRRGWYDYFKIKRG